MTNRHMQLMREAIKKNPGIKIRRVNHCKNLNECFTENHGILSFWYDKPCAGSDKMTTNVISEKQLQALVKVKI